MKSHNRKPIKSFPSSPSKTALLLFSMASLLFLSFISLLLFFSLSSSSSYASNHHHNRKRDPKTIPTSSSPEAIQQACKATRFPQQCQTSLSQSSSKLPPNPSSLQILQSAISVSSENLKTAMEMVESILRSSSGSQNRTTAANNCLEVLRNSDHRTSLAAAAFPAGKTKDARAWMSAALLFQYDCWSALKYANDTKIVGETMSFLDSLTGLSSNALSMMVSYDCFGADTKPWAPPKTERDGFWENGSGGGSGRGNGGGFAPSKLTADATVCKDGNGDGGGCYKTVQDAVNAAPDNVEVGGKRFVIHIKEGVYEETVRVPLEKRNVVFLGDGMGKTVITGSLNVGQPGLSTYNTATVGKSSVIYILDLSLFILFFAEIILFSTTI